MMYRTMLKVGMFLFVLLAVTGLIGLAPADDQKDEGFTDLFNGKDLNGWKVILQGNGDAEKTFMVKDGVLVCTGKPNGYIYTEKTYKNYVLKYGWKYARPEGLKKDEDFPGNSGCLVHIQKPGTPAVGGLWPQCVEVQGANRNHGVLLFLATKGKAPGMGSGKKKATKPVGEWNETEITCTGNGGIVAKVNGASASMGRGELTEGHIGFQSEGAEIHFRDIKIKEMK